MIPLLFHPSDSQPQTKRCRMQSSLKYSFITIALGLPLWAGCIDTSGASSAGNNTMDPSKPQVEDQPKAFTVTPSFTGPILAGNNTLSLGGSTTLSISTNIDVGPTPYYIQIFDLTYGADAGIGTLIRSCASGTTCATGPLSLSREDTRMYVAFVSGYGTTVPPPNVVAQSPKTFVTWTSSGYSLAVPTVLSCVNPGVGQVTATANIDVGPTIYYIEIFDQFGSRLNSCGWGTTCTAQFPCGSVGISAFISNSATAYPPGLMKAASNTVIPTVSVQ